MARLFLAPPGNRVRIGHRNRAWPIAAVACVVGATVMLAARQNAPPRRAPIVGRSRVATTGASAAGLSTDEQRLLSRLDVQRTLALLKQIRSMASRGLRLQPVS